MAITRNDIAQILIDYLSYRITREKLVDWAQKSLMEDDFEENDYSTLKGITGHLSHANVKNGITWEECQGHLQRLGYQIELQIIDQRAV